MSAEGRLTRPNWWVDPEYTYGSVVFNPKNISAERLAEKRIEMYHRFYDTCSTLWRMLDQRVNSHNLWRLLVFMSLNLSANRQEARRFGKPLGGELV